MEDNKYVINSDGLYDVTGSFSKLPAIRVDSYEQKYVEQNHSTNFLSEKNVDVQLAGYFRRRCVDLEFVKQKNYEALKQRESLETLKEEIRIQQGTREFKIFKDAKGLLYLAVEGGKKTPRRISSSTGFETFIYKSKDKPDIIEIIWNEGRYINNLFDGLKSKKICDSLAKLGFQLNASGSMRDDICRAVILYAVNSAQIIILPPCYGWWKDDDGTWNFCKSDEKNYKEVFHYV